MEERRKMLDYERFWNSSICYFRMQIDFYVNENTFKERLKLFFIKNQRSSTLPDFVSEYVITFNHTIVCMRNVAYIDVSCVECCQWQNTF